MKIDLISRKEIVDMLQDAEDETFADAERTMNPIKAIASGIVEEIKNRVIAAPAVDAVEVVHGWWEKVQVWKDNPQTTLRCSLCKCQQPIYDHDEWLYCPFCGMPMDGGASE